MDYNKGTSYPIISNLSRAVAIDIHFSLGYIFWSDYIEKNIKRANFDGTNITVLHNNILYCFGLAVEWRSSQLYWTDETTKTISVSDLEGNNRHILISPSLDQPRGIALDPNNGLMFWTDWGQTPKIERATLSGTQRVAIVTSNLLSPFGIDLDRRNRLVFWVNWVPSKVESVDYHGNNRKLLFRQLGDFSFFGVTFLSSYLFVSDWGTDAIYKFNATNANGTVVSNVKVSPFIDGLIPYDSSRQLSGQSSPTVSPRTTSTLTVGAYVGLTSTTFVRSPRATTSVASSVASSSATTSVALPSATPSVGFSSATPSVELSSAATSVALSSATRCAGPSSASSFLRSLDAASSTSVALLSVPHTTNPPQVISPSSTSSALTSTSETNINPTTELTVKPTTNSSGKTLGVPCNSPCLLVSTRTEIVALDYNKATSYPIISNLSRAVAIDIHFSLGYIFWSDYIEKNIKRANIDGTNITVLHNNILHCFGLAVEWRSSHLYWTDETAKTISVSDLEGNNRHILISPSLDQPRGIALDPNNGLMFWTDWGQTPKIERATLSGTQRVAIVTSNLLSPFGIDLDRQNRLVFWVNWVPSRVESVDYHGNKRKLLFRQLGQFSFFGVTFLSSYLYVSDWGTDAIHKFNATSANGTVVSNVKVSPFVDGLVSYDSFRQLPVITCPALPAPPNGTRLGCQGNATMYYNTSCQFSCNNGYIGSGSQVRRCQHNGTWSGQDSTCQIINCTAMAVDPAGQLRMSSCDNHYGSNCNFSCTIGYRLNGSSTVTCVAPGNQHPGVWNNTIPTCEAHAFKETLFVFFLPYPKLSLVQHCLHRPIACGMVALGMQQSTCMTQSAGSRVLKDIKAVVQAYEDVKRMDNGTEESLLAKESFVNTFSVGKDLKRLVQQLGDVQKMESGVEMTLSV
ncbi:hypothetical protein ACROYT_G034004 [Oculina patagonica]